MPQLDAQEWLHPAYFGLELFGSACGEFCTAMPVARSDRDYTFLIYDFAAGSEGIPQLPALSQ